jgi:undecaprenyl diphosphate synthase
MKQSPLLSPPPSHVGIVMDGNGRWAMHRGQPRVAGHVAGANAVRRIVEAAPGLGIRTLTLYAFSADNWQRPPREVAALMRLFRKYLHSETARLVENGVRLIVIGRRDRLGAALRRAIETAEQATAGGQSLDLRIAIDYSGRDAILRAAMLAGGDAIDGGRFADLLGVAYGGPDSARDVDLIIRTGGEQRLSDFLLWESAYAELHFTARMWPDFRAADLAHAVEDFQRRDRRYGRVMEAVAG